MRSIDLENEKTGLLRIQTDRVWFGEIVPIPTIPGRILPL
jgi:hypothetical protein